MGYYSTIEVKPRINKPKEFNESLVKEKEKENATKSGYNWRNFWLHNIFLEKHEDTKGIYYELMFGDWNFKAYEIEDFVRWLNKFEPSGDLILCGEDGETYGYRFRDGEIIELHGFVIYKEVGRLEV